MILRCTLLCLSWSFLRVSRRHLSDNKRWILDWYFLLFDIFRCLLFLSSFSIRQNILRIYFWEIGGLIVQFLYLFFLGSSNFWRIYNFISFSFFICLKNTVSYILIWSRRILFLRLIWFPILSRHHWFWIGKSSHHSIVHSWKARHSS